MNIMNADSPISVNLRQVSFRPDADVRVFLDGYVAMEGYEIKGYNPPEKSFHLIVAKGQGVS